MPVQYGDLQRFSTESCQWVRPKHPGGCTTLVPRILRDGVGILTLLPGASTHGSRRITPLSKRGNFLPDHWDANASVDISAATSADFRSNSSTGRIPECLAVGVCGYPHSAH